MILVFAPAGHHSHQPVLQYVTFEGERLTVVAPSDETLAAQYGVADHFALFVIGGNGAVAWRHTVDDGASIRFPGPTASSLTRREFIAAMFAASVAATFASTASAGTSIKEKPTTGARTVDVAFVVPFDSDASRATVNGFSSPAERRQVQVFRRLRI